MDEHENCKVLTVPDSTLAEAGCKAVWGFGNQIYLTAGCQRLPDGPSNVKVDEISIHHIKWDTEMHQPIARKLVSEARGIFMSLQRRTPREETLYSKRTQMLKVSREYRSVIKSCARDLQQKSNGVDDDLIRNAEQLEMFEMIELLWSLCEILLIDIIPEGLVLMQLLDWLRLHFYDGDKKAQEVIKSQMADKHEYYWEAVYSLLLQGRVEETRRMLSLHSDHKTENFSLIDTMLKKMPIANSMSLGQSSSEFNSRWHLWQDECTMVMDDGTFANDEHLMIICRILAGDDNIFIDLKEILGTWYCMMISRLFYQAPTVKAIDLQYHTRLCVDTFGGLFSLTPWDHIILAAIELDIHRVIRDCSSSFNSWWFVSHLTDLLYHCGALEPRTLNFGSNLREFLLLEYATSLLSYHSLWQIGLQYLEHCPVYGRHYMIQFLEHIPLETEKKAQKVLRFCEKYNLVEQAKSICKVMGVKGLHNRRLGTALSWGLKSKDANFSAFVADKFLTDYSNSGTFSCLDLIDNLGSSMMLSTKLTFLGKYREFHRLYENKDLKKAAELLLSLLSARIAPKRFWPTLLLDSIPLLEADTVIFSSEQTYELLHCLEELEISKKLDQNLEKQLGSVELEDGLSIVRMAVARNLARAIIEEGSELTTNWMTTY